MVDGLGEAIGRFNKNVSPEPKKEPEGGEEATSGDGKHEGHMGKIMRHKNGKHHVTVHDKNGQLTHHSEHNTWGEASQELGQHGAGSGDEGGPGAGMD